MPFAGFVSFLKNGIFVPQATKFSDKWEGLLPLSKIQAEHREDYREMRDSVAPWTYISCWHLSAHESYAMWQIYGRNAEAVAIETSIEKLQEAYSEAYSSTLAYLSEVTYVNSDTPKKVVLPTAIKKICKPPSNISGGEYYPILLFYYLKHLGYEFEKEVRLVALDEDFEKGSENKKDGIYIDHTKVDEFLEGVRIFPRSPTWFKDVVNDLLRKYDQKIVVNESILNGPQ